MVTRVTLSAAALCPSAPLLVPELCGQRPPLPELREAAAGAVAALLDPAPDLVAVVGPAPWTATWPADAAVDVGPFRGRATTTRPTLPLSLALGATLLRTARYTGETLFQGVAGDTRPDACAALGRSLVERGPGGRGRVALLVVGDGSACRSLKAPGWFDERAAGFDAAVERAVGAGDLGALLDLDPDLAADLQAAGRPAWQVLAGAAHGLPCTARVRYADAPFGVSYLVAALRFGDRRRGAP
jgi:hypothetical protein